MMLRPHGKFPRSRPRRGPGVGTALVLAWVLAACAGGAQTTGDAALAPPDGAGDDATTTSLPPAPDLARAPSEDAGPGPVADLGGSDDDVGELPAPGLDVPSVAGDIPTPLPDQAAPDIAGATLPTIDGLVPEATAAAAFGCG